MTPPEAPSSSDDHRTLASARLEQAYDLGQREGFGAGLVVGVTGSLIAYPVWMDLVDWVWASGILPW